MFNYTSSGRSKSLMSNPLSAVTLSPFSSEARKTHGFSWFIMSPPATCKKIYTAQPNIAHKYCTATETDILHVFLKQHEDNIIRWGAWLPHTSQVMCQYSCRTYSLMHQHSRCHLLAYGEDWSFHLAIWPTFVTNTSWEFPMHFLWDSAGFLSQPLYVTSLCQSAIPIFSLYKFW